MVTTEPYPPYSPPAMADHFLHGRDEPLFWRGKDVTERLGITYHTSTRVTAIDEATRQVVTHGDGRIGYDQLLIASGSRLHAPVEGAELDGVHDFKSLASAEEIMGRVRRGEARPPSSLVPGSSAWRSRCCWRISASRSRSSGGAAG